MLDYTRRRSTRSLRSFCHVAPYSAVETQVKAANVNTAIGQHLEALMAWLLAIPSRAPADMLLRMLRPPVWKADGSAPSQCVGHPLTNQLHEPLLPGLIAGQATGVLFSQLEALRSRTQFWMLG